MSSEKVEGFPGPLPQGHGNGPDTITLLSAQCVTVTGFIGMPVPAAEHFRYLFLFKAKSACARAPVGAQSREWHRKLLFYSQGDTFYTFPEVNVVLKEMVNMLGLRG